MQSVAAAYHLPNTTASVCEKAGTCGRITNHLSHLVLSGAANISHRPGWWPGRIWEGGLIGTFNIDWGWTGAGYNCWRDRQSAL